MRGIYDNSQVNYILEGHAMRHIGLNYDDAVKRVEDWKKRMYGREPNEILDEME